MPETENPADDGGKEANEDKNRPNQPSANGGVIANAEQLIINAAPSEHKAAKQHRDGYDKANIIILSLTLAAAVAAAIFTGLAWLVFKDQLVEMQKAYGPIQKSAEATERQSFAGRAYLFPRYVFDRESLGPQPTDVASALRDGIFNGNTGALRKKISFCIDNVGQSPGMISRIEAHLYLPGMDGMYVSTRDDIEAPEIAATRETYGSPVLGSDGHFFDVDHGSSGALSIPGGTNYCTFTRTFVYSNKTPKDFRTVHGSLLSIYVVYNDIFGITERHTWYEVGLYGAGSAPGLKKYNHWD